MRQDIINTAVENFKEQFEEHIKMVDNLDNLAETEYEHYDDSEYENGLTVAYVDGCAYINYYVGNDWTETENTELTKWCDSIIEDEDYERRH